MNTNEGAATPAEESPPAWTSQPWVLVGQRIREARGPMSQEELAQRVHLHVNTIGKFERGRALPDVEQVVQIAQACGVSAAWVLLGAPYPRTSGAPAPAESGEFAFVQGYNVEASAGEGAQVFGEDVIGRFAFRRSWLARKGLNPHTLAIVSARGDSMEPTVREGDLLLIDRNVTRLANDGIYLVERGGELFCKRLQSMFTGGVTIMSDNPKYKPQELDAAEAGSLRVAGRVVWIGGER